jgi:predicted RecA/RadA family phage recombinase
MCRLEEMARRYGSGPAVRMLKVARVGVVVAVVVGSIGAGAGRNVVAAGAFADGPRMFVNTNYVPPAGKTITVRAGGDLQTTLDAARPGEAIELEAGKTWRGSFRLPKKQGDGWII